MKSRLKAVHAGAQGADHVDEVPQQPRSPYLTSRDALGYLRLRTLSALYSHMRDNRLPYQRVGRSLRFDIRELDAWMRGADSALTLVRRGGASPSQSRVGGR